MAANNTATAEDLKMAQALAQLPGREKLKMLLVAEFGSVAQFALKHGRHPQQVHMCLSGEREYPEIRDDIAAALPSLVDRARVDELIGSPKAA